MIRGHLDIVNNQEIAGWVWDDVNIEARQTLDITVNDQVVSQTIADEFRPDLQRAGISDGHCSFRFKFPLKLSVAERHVIRVLDRNGDDINPGPIVIEPAEQDKGTAASKPHDRSPNSSGLERLDVLTQRIRRLIEDETSPPEEKAAILKHLHSSFSDVFSTPEPENRPESIGSLDEASLRGVSGWAQDAANQDQPVSLLVSDNDVLMARVLANRFRKDLEEAGMGSGRFAFKVDFPGGGLSPFERHEIRVRREIDGLDLPGSPLTIEPTSHIDEDAKTFLSRLFSQGRTREDLTETIEFLAGETASLMNRVYDLDSRSLERQDYKEFLSRWRRRLPDAELAVASDRAPAPVPRALIIDDRVPKSDRDAGSNAILSHAQSLQRLGYQVVFVPVGEMRKEALDVSSLSSLNIDCCHIPYYASVEDVLICQAGEFDVILMHRVFNAFRYGQLARAYFPKARIIYSVADLHHLRYERQAKVTQRPALQILSARLKRAELLSAEMSDAVITHSTHEADELAKFVRRQKIHVVPWSIPVRPVSTPFSKRSNIAFIGSYEHEPNQDAAHWLISEIMPCVWKLDPNIHCLLVGSGMPDSLRQQCRSGIEAIGYVDDLHSILEQVRLTVAPLTFGAGLKGKVLESLAAGIPCVCSPIAAEGIALPISLQALVAGDAPTIAKSIVELHSNQQANEACAKDGLAYILEAFSEPLLDSAIKRIIGDDNTFKIKA